MLRRIRDAAYGGGLIAVLAAVLSPMGVCRGQDGQSIARELKTGWLAIKDFEITYRETQYGNDPGRGEIRYSATTRLRYRSPNQWSIYTVGGAAGEPAEVVRDVRYDGTKEHRVDYVPKSTKVVDKVVSRAQEGEGTYYPGVMDPMTWLLVPDRRPPYFLIPDEEANGEARGTTVAIDARKASVVKPTRFANATIKVDLDASHSWAPMSIEIGNVRRIHSVRFKKYDGFWFPESAESETTGPSGVGYATVQTESVRVNPALDRSAFAPPSLEKGALVVDSATGKGVVVGGKSRRGDFVEKHLKEPTPALPPVPRNYAGSSESDAWPLAQILGFASAAIVIGLLAFKLRRPR